MFGHRFFGQRYFGEAYFGDGGVQTAVSVPRALRVIALVARPFDATVTRMVEGPPWPLGVFAELEGAISDFEITGGEIELYASDVGYHSHMADTPADAWFPGAMPSPFNYSIRVFEGGRPGGPSRIGAGDIVIRNAKGERDDWLGKAFDGREIRLYRGRKDAAFSTFDLVFVGTCIGLDWTDTSITIRLRDRQAPFQKPIQSVLYGGSGGLDGDASIAGQPKAICYGVRRNIPVRLIDATNGVRQFHDGVSQAVLAVRDKGVGYDFVGDFANYDDLVAATVNVGEYATCLAFSLIRTLQPLGLLTADVQGDASGSYIDTAAQIASRIAMERLGQDNFGGTDIIGAAALDLLQSGATGYYCDSAGVTVQQALDEIMGGIGGYWWATLAGKLQLARLDLPTGSADIVIERDNILSIGRVGVLPIHLLRVGYERMIEVQSADQLAEPPGVSEADRQRYGSAYRYITTQDPSLVYAHQLAQQLDFPTQLDEEADALAEALRLRDLHGAERSIYSIEARGLDIFDVPIGGILSIQNWSRLGLDPAGQKFVIIGAAANVETDSLSLFCWG